MCSNVDGLFTMQNPDSVEPRLAFTVVSVNSGRRFRIIVKEKDRYAVRVLNIKRNLAVVAHVPIEQQILELNGQPLDDRATGADIELSPNTVLTLRIIEEGQKSERNSPQTKRHSSLEPRLMQGQNTILNPVNTAKESVPGTRLSEVLARGLVIAAVKYERQRRECNGLEVTETKLANKARQTSTMIDQSWREVLELCNERANGLEVVNEAIARYQDITYQLSNPDALTVFLGMRTEQDWESQNSSYVSIPATIGKLSELIEQMENEYNSLKTQLAQEARRKRKLRVQLEELQGMTRMYLHLMENSKGGDSQIIKRDSTSCNILAHSGQCITVQFDKIFTENSSLFDEISALSGITLDGYSLILAITGNRALDILGNGGLAETLVNNLFHSATMEHMSLVIETSCIIVEEGIVLDAGSESEVGVCSGTPVGLRWNLCLDEGEAATAFVKTVDILSDTGRESTFVIRVTRQGSDNSVIHSYIYFVFSESNAHATDMAAVMDGTNITPQDSLSRFQLAVSPPEDLFFADVIISDDTDSEAVLKAFSTKH